MSVLDMHKLWIRRKAVSSMIGGIIVLSVFLSALVFMILVSQQYDAYQSTAAAMQQKQIDMYSENILAAYPGITNGTGTSQVNCAGGQCNNYTLVVNNLGISTQIVRVYINSAIIGCNLCVLDPASSPTPMRFRVSDQYVNPGESSHMIVFWLPVGISLSSCTNNSECKVSIVTARGRVFSFLWPFPTIQMNLGAAQGGTGIYIGPLVITFQKALITYTNNVGTLPQIPLGGPNGYWVLPKTSGSNGIIIYIKLQTDVGVLHDVYLTPQSVFEIAQFTSPGVINAFFAIAPITQSFCGNFISSTYNPDLDCTLSTYPTDPTKGNNNGNPSSLIPYLACGNPPPTYDSTHCGTPRYVIPKPTTDQLNNHQKGTPVIVAFAVKKPSGRSSDIQTIQWSLVSVTSFLGLSYVYNNGTAPYLYGVTLPFIALCIGDTNNPPSPCSI